jgi:hypothetical protein
MFAQISNGTDSKKFCPTFADIKSQTAQQQPSDAEGVPRGKAWVSFLATSWETLRSSIKKQSAQREAV